MMDEQKPKDVNEEEMEQVVDAAREDPCAGQYATQITVTEYEQQKKEYTQSSVEQLLYSDEYQRKWLSCGTCWNPWKDGKFSRDCQECGGHTLTRPCPVCDGRCGVIWKRNVEMSHSSFEAYWDGECGLPAEEQQGFLLQKLCEPDEDSLMGGLKDLTVGHWDPNDT